MKKTKLLISLLLVFSLLLPLAACGGEEIEPIGDLDAQVTGSGSVEGFEYNVYSDGTVGITKYTGGYTRHTVPSEIDGMQVSRIEEKAYFDCGLVKVTIPDSVIYIGESAFEQNQELIKVDMSDNCLYIGAKAFYNCLELKKVDVPNCLESIGPYAFTLTEWLNSAKEDFVIVGQGILIRYLGHEREVTIPEEVRFISTAFTALNGRMDGIRSRLEKVNIGENVEIIGDCAFNLCTHLSDIKIPETVTYIGERAFADCVSITELEIPTSITRIEDYTFFSCEGLVEYTVPDHIQYVGYKAFGKCLNLEVLNIGSGAEYIDPTVVDESDLLAELNVSADNQFYTACDLTLYNKDMSILYYYHRYKPDTELHIPDSVVEIGRKAFYGATNLTEIYFSDSLEVIGLGAFDGCEGIEYLHFSDKLKVIGNSAFLNCPSFNEIFYAGTREQWDAIEVGENNIAFNGTFVNYEWVE